MEPGRYRACVADVNLGHSSMKGTPYVRVVFRVIEGECEGEDIEHFMYLSDKTEERTFVTLRHMGFQGDDIGVMLPEDLPNVMEILVGEETFNHRTMLRVLRLARDGELSSPSMDDASRQSLADRMKRLARRFPPMKPAASSRTQPLPMGAQSPQRNGVQQSPSQRHLGQRAPGDDVDDMIPF